jgi:hypothetical protein
MGHPATVNISPADTPLEDYRQPILQALDQIGGRVPLLNLHPRVVEIMKDALKPGDYELDDGKIKYIRAILVQGAQMIPAGLITQPLPFVWEITEEGRQQL